MINNLPNGWRVEELGNMNLDISDGNYSSLYPTQNEFIENGIPFIRANNISRNTIIDEDMRFISEEKHAILKKGQLKQNDLLFTNRGIIGQVGLVPDKYIGANINAQIVRINSGNKFTNKYLMYCFLKQELKNQMTKLETGSTLKQLPIGQLKKLNIPIPPLQQQEKIVKILDITSNLIEKQKELLKNYDLFLKSKFIEMFGNPIKNTMKWEMAQIKELIIKIKNDNPLKQPQKIYIYIDIGSINDKYIKHYNCILGENAPSRAKQITIYNDILVSTVRPNLNAVAIVKSKYESILSSTGFCVLRTNNKNITPYYLFEIVKHKDFIQSLMNVAKGASYPAVSNNDILNLKISIPPLELQNKFASIVEKIEIIKEKENQKLKQLEDLHNSMMNKAFKGEIE